MQLNLKRVLLIGTLLVVTATSVFAQEKGQERGNGTEDMDDTANIAWLVGKQNANFRYCVKIASGFNYTNTKFKIRLDRALQRWRDYFQSVGMLDALAQKGYPLPLMGAVEVSCGSDHEITFYLGEEDAIVSLLKKQYRNPTAFAFRTENEKGKTGKGLIWFAMPGSVHPERRKPNETIAFPNWIENDEVFEMFLIHEIGHTYGLPHVDGTIMDESLAQIASENKIERRHIEWTRELISLQSKESGTDLVVFNLDGVSVGSSTSTYRSAVFNFQSVKKQYFQGDVIAEDFQGKKSNLLHVVFDYSAGGLSDGRYENIACFVKSEILWESHYCFSNSIMSMNGVATDFMGITYPALMEYNYSRVKTDWNRTLAAPYVLKIFKNGNWETYFEAGRPLI